MNYMRQIAEMLGVKIEEYFYLTDERGYRDQYDIGKPYRYCLTTAGLYYQTDHSGSYNSGRLQNLLCGKFTIEKIPWKPHLNERYYYITCDGFTSVTYNTHGTYDAANISLGNCFRTKEEAKAHRDEILSKIKAVFDGE